ncbi:hypothetical protein Btru_062127, partial [Bulinus truncatus]
MESVVMVWMKNSGSSALHEAVRFNRIEVVKLLVAFQADPDLQNSNRETPRILAYELPSLLSQKIAPFFQDHSLVTPRSPKMINSIELLESAENNNTVFTCQKSYPELPNDLTWTKNEPLYCSSCTEKNPNSHILDGNLFTFWVIPVLHDAWTILDLHSEHIITGITIYGWNSPQMIKTVHLQCALSINGPWKNVTTLECKCQGSTDSKDPGSIDIARELIYHSAELTARDAKGNTALHLAGFCGSCSLDLIELLLANSVEVNAVNNDGNTALHIFCQSQDRAVPGCQIIKKLLESGIDVWIKNKFKLTALDLAASFNKKEAVRLLLHHVPLLRNNSRAIVEASVRGFTDIVELLLEYGVSCNGLDENSGSSALHEAVRFNRIEVVKLLVAFQADPDLQNSNRETPRILAYELPSLLSQKIAPFFQGIQDQVLENYMLKYVLGIQDQVLENYMLKYVLGIQDQVLENYMLKYVLGIQDQVLENNMLKYVLGYPELPNDLTWTKNEPLYCSSCTEKNPNSHILDGITIYGWNSPQMIKTVHLQCALSINGPWKNVTTLECKCQGSTDSKDPASPQKFTGFSFCSQYIRLYLLDNHSGSYMCFQGIQLHGADHQILNALAHCGLQMLADNFINK